MSESTALFRSRLMRDRHLVIAGTGRAGTSFLVKFLAACGLETADQPAGWHARARAGAESRLDGDLDLPYVVKDPWLWTYCRSLDLNRLRIEALLVPVRDLASAAASRVLQERAAMAETLLGERANLMVSASTPGGVIFSLSIVDQARILAVGFHDLVEWAVSNDIPVVLLSFPRLVEDGEYAVSALWPFLEAHLDREAALAAFARVSDPAAIRVHGQLGTTDGFGNYESDDDAELDRAGLVIRIGEMRAEADITRERLTAVEAELAAAQAGRVTSDSQLTQVQTELAEARARVIEVSQGLSRCRDELNARHEAVGTLQAELARHRAWLDGIQRSFSWRMTHPLRAAKRRMLGAKRP